MARAKVVRVGFDLDQEASIGDQVTWKPEGGALSAGWTLRGLTAKGRLRIEKGGQWRVVTARRVSVSSRRLEIEQAEEEGDPLASFLLSGLRGQRAADELIGRATVPRGTRNDPEAGP